MRCKRLSLSLAVSLLTLPCIAVGTPVLGQVDTFETGPEGWHIGGGPLGIPVTPLSTVVGGGPAGAGDNYLLLTGVGGGGPGSRPAGINLAQWAGDYGAAGVNAITLDLRNLGSSDLFIRLLLAATLGPLGPENIVITEAVEVKAGANWSTHVFSLRESDLTVLAGTAAAALADTFELRIFHNPAAVFPGPALAGQLGVDNIAAANIPEPGTTLLLVTGLAALGVKLSRRSRYHRVINTEVAPT